MPRQQSKPRRPLHYYHVHFGGLVQRLRGRARGVRAVGAALQRCGPAVGGVCAQEGRWQCEEQPGQRVQAPGRQDLRRPASLLGQHHPAATRHGGACLRLRLMQPLGRASGLPRLRLAPSGPRPRTRRVRRGCASARPPGVARSVPARAARGFINPTPFSLHALSRRPARPVDRGSGHHDGQGPHDLRRGGRAGQV